MKTRILSLAAASVAVALLGSSAHAVDGTWTVDANGVWSLPANWVGGTVADGADATANFTYGITAGRTVTNDAPRTIGNLLFNDTGTAAVVDATADSGWTLTGTAANPLTLSTAGGTSTITTQSAIGFGAGATISAVVSGTNNVVFVINPVVPLSPAAVSSQPNITINNAANNYTGSSTIANGFLNIGANSLPISTNSALGNSASAIVLGNASTSISVGVNTGQPSVGLDLQYSGVVATNFTIARNIDSSATADVAGRTNIRFNNNTVGGNGTLTISGNWALGTNATHSYGIVAQQPGQTVNFTGNITGTTATSVLRVNDFGNGNGTLRLAGTNTYAGVTIVEEGALIIGANAPATNGALGNNAAFQLASNGVTALNSANANATIAATTDGGFTVNKNVTLSTSSFTPTGGTLTQSAHSWTLGGSSANASVFTGNVNSPSVVVSRTLNLTQVAGGSSTFSGIFNANADANNVTVIEKTGAGTVLLTNANTYDGGTRITGGTLLVNNATGSGTGTGAVSVGVVTAAQSGVTSTTPGATAARTTRQLDGISAAVASGLQVGQTVTGTGITPGSVIQTIAFNPAGTASIGISTTVTVPTLVASPGGLVISDLAFGALATTGTLGGAGIISGTTTVNAGSSLAPGNATIGTLTVGSASILGILAEEIGATTSDTLADVGALTLDAASILNLSTLATPTAPLYTLATFTSLTGTFGTVTGTPTGYTLNYLPTAITLTANVVPEPATLGVFAAASTMLLRRRRSAK